MSPYPYRLLRADPTGGGSPDAYLTPAPPKMKPARALHIAPEILALPGLDLTACAVLAEVLDLYQVKQQVFADDAHFAARCKCSERTVRSKVAELQQAGHLERETDQRRATGKRLLTPTAACLALAAPANSARATPEAPAEFAGGSGNSCHRLRQNLPEAPANSANINTSLNTKTNTKSTTTPQPRAADAAGGGEKKIGAGSPPEKPERPASHTRGAAPAKAKPETSDALLAHFAAFWAAWPRKEAKADAARAFAKLKPDDQAAAASRADTWLAARPDLLDPGRYRFIPHATTWLNQARWTDANPSLPTVSADATANRPFPQQRSTNGFKPDDSSADLARAIAELN